MAVLKNIHQECPFEYYSGITVQSCSQQINLSHSYFPFRSRWSLSSQSHHFIHWLPESPYVFRESILLTKSKPQRWQRFSQCFGDRWPMISMAPHRWDVTIPRNVQFHWSHNRFFSHSRSLYAALGDSINKLNFWHTSFPFVCSPKPLAEVVKLGETYYRMEIAGQFIYPFQDMLRSSIWTKMGKICRQIICNMPGKTKLNWCLELGRAGMKQRHTCSKTNLTTELYHEHLEGLHPTS